MSELDGIKETLEILSNPSLVESIQRGLKDLHSGKVHKLSSTDGLDEFWRDV